MYEMVKYGESVGIQAKANILLFNLNEATEDTIEQLLQLSLFNFNMGVVKETITVNETILAYFYRAKGADYSSPGVAYMLFG